MKKFVYILGIVFISSCSIFHKTNNNKPITGESFIDSVNKDFKTLTYKFNATYKSKNQNLSFFGTTKIIKDSILYLNISPGLGITIAEIFINPDTILIYMPLQKGYIAGNQQIILDKFGIAMNFFSLQSVLCSNLFSYPFFIDLKNYQLNKDTIYHFQNFIYNKSNSKVIDVAHIFNINKEFDIINFEIYDNLLHKDFFVNYSNYKNINNFVFPEKIDYTLIGIDTISLSFTCKKAVYNSGLDINFKIPENAKIINY